jgi:alpha-ketoglutarate-dependent taurine dioxygenase
MQIKSTTASLGAYISGVHLPDLTDREWEDLHGAFLRYGVLVFPEQKLTQKEQVAFGRRFGELATNRSASTEPKEEKPGRPPVVDGEVVLLSNVDPTGLVISDPDHPQVAYLAGNDVWHTDASYKRVTAKATLLSCVECATTGGETAFADMRAALEAMTPGERDRLAGLRAWHSFEYSQALRRVGDPALLDDPTTMEGAYHAMVRRHPETGRESLFIGRHACAIEGMELAAAQRLLEDLHQQACKPPRVMAHKWSVGDLVVWDNRCLLHRVQPWDLRERRVMWHVRTAGEESEAA